MILLRQKTYARRDYAGLDEKAQNELRAIRSAQAQKLRTQRDKIWDRVNVQQENINKAHEFLANPGAAWATPEYEKALNNLPGGVREQANQMMSGHNKAVLEEDLKRDWRQRYEKALKNSADDMGFEREELLRDTKRRAQHAQPEAATNQPKANSSQQGAANQQAKKNSEGFISKNWGRVKRLYTGKSKYGRAGQAGAIGTTALAVGGVGYGLYKRNKKKNKKNNSKEV